MYDVGQITVSARYLYGYIEQRSKPEAISLDPASETTTLS